MYLCRYFICQPFFILFFCIQIKMLNFLSSSLRIDTVPTRSSGKNVESTAVVSCPCTHQIRAGEIEGSDWERVTRFFPASGESHPFFGDDRFSIPQNTTGSFPPLLQCLLLLVPISCSQTPRRICCFPFLLGTPRDCAFNVCLCEMIDGVCCAGPR